MLIVFGLKSVYSRAKKLVRRTGGCFALYATLLIALVFLAITGCQCSIQSTSGTQQKQSWKERQLHTIELNQGEELVSVNRSGNSLSIEYTVKNPDGTYTYRRLYYGNTGINDTINLYINLKENK